MPRSTLRAWNFIPPRVVAAVAAPRTSVRRLTALKRWWTLGRLERAALPLGFLLYALWATNITWPLLTSPAHSVLGGLGDQTGGIAQVREWIQSGVFPFAPGTVHDFSAPEGLQVAWGVNLSGWPYVLVIWLLALAIGPIAALSLTTWAGIVASGLTMQVLASRLTGSRLAGLVAGFAFAFYPFAIVNAATHPQFAHGWPFALLAWRMFEVSESVSRRNVTLALLASVLLVAFSPYHVLIGGVLIATCMALILARAWRQGTLRIQLRVQALIAGVTLAYLAVIAAVTLGAGGDTGGTLRQHSEQELFTYAARSYEYVVPFGRNKLFGTKTAPWLQAHVHGSNFSESTLYLGVVVLALGLVGFVAAMRRRTSPRLRRALVAGVVIAVVGFVWSAPPRVKLGGALLPAPSDVVQHLTTTWRVYSRFVLDVMLGATLMAATGVAVLTRGRHPLVAAAVTVVLLAAIGLDFTWRPGVTRLADPPVYRILRDRPGGIVAQYPLLPSGYGDSADIYYQDAHKHPMLNGYAETGFDDRRAMTLYSLDRYPTARGLASLGVRYVMLPDDLSAYAGTPDPGKPGRGFQKIGTGRYGGITASVYRVTAPPDLGYAYVRVGGGADEGPPDDPFEWISAPRAELTVDAPGCSRPCRGTLHLRLESLVSKRMVRLQTLDGRPLWHGLVLRPREVAIPLSVASRARIRLTTTPGPAQISKVVPGNSDSRTVSVAVSRLRFTR